MSWVRIDDGFTANSKIAQLTDAEFRCWMRLLCHCAKSHDPSVDRAAIREVSGLTLARISRYFQLNLLDQVGADQANGYEIHDWTKYLPKDSATERQARWRARTAETHASTQTSTNGVSKASTKKSTRAQAHADSRPVPSHKEQRAVSESSYDDIPEDAGPPDHDEQPPIDINEYTQLIAKEIPL